MPTTISASASGGTSPRSRATVARWKRLLSSSNAKPFRRTSYSRASAISRFKDRLPSSGATSDAPATPPSIRSRSVDANPARNPGEVASSRKGLPASVS